MKYIDFFLSIRNVELFAIDSNRLIAQSELVNVLYLVSEAAARNGYP